jgi:N-carbamoyl-L-amino-acid hydrolase
VSLVLVQGHRECWALGVLLAAAEAAAATIAEEERTPVQWRAIQHVDPVRFDDALVSLAEECVRSASGDCLRLPSGALHDAVMAARAGIPTVMLFVQSLGGISHNRLEDSRREHLEQGVTALDLLARRIALARGG